MVMTFETPKPRLSNRSKIPALADQATDLKALREALVDASSVSIGLWVSYILVLLYLYIALSGITHRGLLLEEPVKLPFLNVDLPLVSFFVLGPLLFLLVHAYMLLHLLLFSGKVGKFHYQLQSQIADSETRAALRWQLPSNVFVQTLAGSRDVRKRFPGRLFRLITQISLIAAPVVLLAYFQIQFLPYHPSPSLSFWLRAAILVDIVLLWKLWPSIVRGKIVKVRFDDVRNAIVVLTAAGKLLKSVATLAWVEPHNEPIRRHWRSLLRVRRHGAAGGAAVLSVLVIAFTFVVATYPGELLNRSLEPIPFVKLVRTTAFSGDPDEVTGRLSSWFSDRLIVTDQDLAHSEGRDRSLVRRSFRGRDLRGAILNRSDLTRADFTGANLATAQLKGAKLEGAQFSCIDTSTVASDELVEKDPSSPSPTYYFGDLANKLASDVGCADLRRADLFGAALQDAKLAGTALQRANLMAARLQGADLEFANMRGANLFGADLTGATLDNAKLEFTDMFAADLQAASLAGAQLQGTNLHSVRFDGANLFRAALQEADLGSGSFAASLRGSFLESAMLLHTSGAPDVAHVDLSKLDFLIPAWGDWPPRENRMRFCEHSTA
jgi:uncharacterized protein YjbI with pentapeptide repeats